MPYARLTLDQLQAGIASDIVAAMPIGADPLLRFSNLNIIGTVQGLVANGHYGYLDWIALQSVPFTATDAALEGWAALKNVVRESAVAATGTVSFGNSTPTTDLPSGTPITRGDGVAYVTTADAVVNGGGVVVAPVVATVAAAVSTLTVGMLMNLATAISGIQSTGAVVSTLIPGADAELDPGLRGRMLQAYASPPQGGALSDYIGWALDVPGATRAWVLPNGGGAGTVWVYIMLDVSRSAFAGFPQGSNGTATGETRDTNATGDQLAVANFIFDPSRQPVTALVYAIAPTPNAVNFTISGISGASTATKAAIAAAIAGAMASQQGSGPGGSYDVNRVLQGTLALSFIEAAVAAVPLTTGFVITSPTINIVSGAGQIPVLGTVTYT